MPTFLQIWRTSESFEPLQLFLRRSSRSLCVCANMLSQLWPFHTRLSFLASSSVHPHLSLSGLCGHCSVNVMREHCLLHTDESMSPPQTAGCFQLWRSFQDPYPPEWFPFLKNCLFCAVSCGSWLPEQVVQALLPDRHLQGLWREVRSASWPRWPGISSGCSTLDNNISLILNMVFG